jgi:hypothetical protein
MRRPARVLAVAALASALTASACSGGGGGGGTGQSNPRAELAAAFTNADQTSALTLTLHLQTDAAAIQALASEQGDTLSSAEAQAIAGAQLQIEVKSGGGNLSAAAGRTALRILASDNGRGFVDLRYVGHVLYLKVDLSGLLQVVNRPQLSAQLSAEARRLPSFARSFLAGHWVSLDTTALFGMLSGLGVNVAPSTSPGQNDRVLNDLRTALERDLAVKRVGSTVQGDHLQLTGHTRQLVGDLVTVVRNDLPGGAVIASGIKLDSVPLRSVTLDAYVRNGTLNSLSLDLAQFAPPAEKKPTDHLPLTLDFSRSGAPITAPAGAIVIQPSQLTSLFGRLSGG